jgi:hypothetical protein
MKVMLVMVTSLLVAPAVALAQGARLQIDHLDRLAATAANAVNITVDPSMLKLASSFLNGKGDDAAIKELLNGLKGIYVKAFEFDNDNAYTPDDVNTIRRQLMTPGWAKLVTVDNKRERELVEVYSWREGNASGGIAVLAAEPRELTVVNIVGPIDLAKLSKLQGQFGIPRLPHEAASGK